MLKIKYILEILVVLLMGVSFVFDIVSNDFSSASFSTLTTAILLGVSFYESYAKDKIILKLKEEKYK